MGKRLYGYVAKENVEYEWKSEPGACEVCQGMSGTIYDTANDIPDRPHPNCKCWIDILEKESDEPITDPIESHRERIKEKKREELELAKLLGDAKSLEQEIDEYIYRIDSQDKEIERLENSIDTNKLNPKDKQKISEVKKKIDFARYKGDRAKQDVTALETEIERAQVSENISDVLDKLYYQYKVLQRKTEEYLVNDADKWLIDGLGSVFAKWHNLPESLELYKIASPNLEPFTKDYIQKNGRLFDKISDLHSNQLKKDIQSRLQKETGKTDCKILLLNSDSSMSKSILTNSDFKTFINQNIDVIRKNGTIPNSPITFQYGDMYNALHGAEIKDVKIDNQGNLIMRIEDLYNFEPNRTSTRGRTGERLQNKGDLKNYYIIILIKIPKEQLPKAKL